MGNLILDYFNDLFSVTSGYYSPIVNFLEHKIMIKMNVVLFAPFICDEFHKAMFQIH